MGGGTYCRMMGRSDIIGSGMKAGGANMVGKVSSIDGPYQVLGNCEEGYIGRQNDPKSWLK